MKKMKNFFTEMTGWLVAAGFIIFLIIACLLGLSIINGVLYVICGI